ncbi:MAG: class I SAM-dependent methyltransferase [Chloroflexi bacterium]|nr:class I SAM-dependent methyltransferase [Chloroflexota bacterium]
MARPEGVSFDSGSFKDPHGGVFFQGARVFRYLTPEGAASFQALAASGLLEKLSQKGSVIGAREVPPEEAAGLLQAVPGADLVVEHPRLPFISYCYEWPFKMLKAAALLHLEVLAAALERGYILKDATPYNIQFLGPRPVLVDVASFEPYREGDPWNAYSQFCRLFLNPLLLQALTGVRFQGWLRGSLDGIAPAELSRLLPWRHKLRPSVFLHVVLQTWLDRRAASADAADPGLMRRKISRKRVTRLVERVRSAVEGLRSGPSASPWARYDDENTYSEEARACKDAFVERTLAAQKPGVVWDLGCNTGRYSFIAARHAEHVVAMDSDPDAVDRLYLRARGGAPNVLPLVIDLLDPSPDHGWAQAERRGLSQRGPADLALCLALVHHLAIAGNVPLRHVVAWLARVARSGIIEFVPKEDPGAQSLLRWRRDVYPAYTQAAFEAALEERFQIIDQRALPGSGRVLYSLAQARPREG